MKRAFFITGLPRTRTAWLANFFTYGNSFCFHEYCREREIEKMAQEFQLVGAEAVGTADSGLTLYHGRVLDKFENPAIVIIHRDVKAACASFEKFIKGRATMPEAGPLFEKLQEHLEDFKRHLRDRKALEIPFDDLRKASVCANLWAYCTGEPFHTRRWKMLNDLNVQVIPGIAIARARGNAEQLLNVAKLNASGGGAAPPYRRGPLQDEYNGLLLALCRNTPGAAAWVQSLWEILLTWDHVEDGDPIDKAMANRAFEALMLYWPQNPFFLAHKERLLPVMLNAISAWRHSNNGGPGNKGWDFYTEVPCTMAAIIGGMDAVNKYLPRLRDLAEQLRAADDEEDKHDGN